MLSLLSTLSLMIACGEKESITDTGTISEDTGLEAEDTGVEDTNVEDTQDTEDTTDTEDTQDTQDTSDTNTDTGSTSEIELTNLDQEGPYNASSTSESVSLSACNGNMNFTHVVTSNSDAPTVVVAHGFSRDSSKMVEWGAHLGSWGLNALIVDLCKGSEHEQNGLAIAELSSSLGLDSVLYMGFSAGGLASLYAAANSQPLGVMALDPVDDGFGNGTNNLYGQVSANVLGLIGEPSWCNSFNNGIGLLDAVDAQYSFHITDADHADFEAPSDELFEILCGNQSASISDDSIRSTIRELATAGLLWMSGNSEAADWWTGNENQSMQSQGLISPL